MIKLKQGYKAKTGKEICSVYLDASGWLARTDDLLEDKRHLSDFNQALRLAYWQLDHGQ